MQTKERIDLKDLSEYYNVSLNFLRTMMCRPEFTKYMYSRNCFKNCYWLHEEIKKYFNLKMKSKRCMLKNIAHVAS